MISDRLAHVILPLELAVLCVSCNRISDSPGDRCMACDAVGSLLSLSRVLDRAKEPDRG